MSTARHLDRLFEGCERGLVEVRAVPSGQREWTELGKWSCLGKFVTAAVRARQSVLVGAATRRDTTDGTETNLAECTALFCDLDLAPAVARARIASFPFRPSLFVASGCGSHVYFRLKEPLILSDAAERARTASLLRRLSGFLGGDTRATSPAVAPRLVGTKNWKYGEARPVALVEETDYATNPSELEDFLPREIIRNNQFVLADTVPVGARNDQLFRLARSLRAKGLPMPIIANTVRSVNRQHCQEPLPEAELMTLLHHAMTHPDRPDFIRHEPRPTVVHRGNR